MLVFLLWTFRMRVFLLSVALCGTNLSAGFAQSNTEERSNVLYVVGRVTSATDTSCLIDIGAVQTIASQNQLAVFRPIDGYYKPIGRITVVHTEATTSHCTHRIRTQHDDIVMTVREISQLRPGARHREHIVRRKVVEARHQTSSTTVNHVRTAHALSDYEKQFPKWEQSRGAVVGQLLSATLKDSADNRLERLTSQVNLMRRLYQQGAQTVDAAGEVWASVMPVLAGQTAAAGHALRVKDQQEGDIPPNAVKVAAAELRDRVFERFYHLEQEQQNILALVVASQISKSVRNNQALLKTTIDQTQFEGLGEDEQLLEDIERLVLDLRDRTYE
jgi:hypothetical protein